MGYGVADPTAWRSANSELLAIYELDVASLLVAVACEESEDGELFEMASRRVTELLAELGR